MTDRPIPMTLSGWPTVTPRAVVDHDVDREIAAYERRQAPEAPVWLDLPRLREALAGGEVRFGARDLPVPAIDPALARRAAAEAVADGLVLMFIDGRPVSDLDERWEVSEDSRVRYVRLSAQRGL